MKNLPPHTLLPNDSITEDSYKKKSLKRGVGIALH